MNEKKIIVIVDDNAAFRESAQWWLMAADYEVETFACPVVALDYLSTALMPCGKHAGRVCVLMDVRMPKMSGLDLHDELHARGLYPPVIYMTGHGAVSLAVEAMKKGAVTFLEKPFDDTKLLSALDIAFSQVTSTVEKNINSSYAQEKNRNIDDETNMTQKIYQQRYAKLTPRERQVLQGVVDGKLNKVIADKLSISIKTVEVHRARLIKKLEARNLPEMVKMVVTGRI